MADKKIYVGSKYKTVFDSIVGLANKKALPNLDIKVIDNEIHSKQKIFAYDNKMTSVNDNFDTSITENGASWFGVFRNMSIDTSDSEWIDFVDEVSESYHKEYSFFEFPEINHKKNESQITNEKRTFGALSKIFFKNIYDDLHLIDTANIASDVFGVNLRLEINRGTGALQPLMGKVYFEKDQNGNLNPLAISVADEIEGFLTQSMVSSGVKKINSSIEETEKLSNLVCASLDMLISGKTIYNFADCFSISAEEDVEIMEEIIRRGSAGILDISCTNVRILSITHTLWENQVYYVGKENTRLLEFKFGLNNSVTLRCVNCLDDIIIDNNRIHCFNPNTSEEFDIFIDFNNPDAVPNIGLTLEQIEEIRINGPFKKHLFANACFIKNRNVNCSRIVCSCQSITSGNERVCKNCPYPEKLYTNKNGFKIITSKAGFDRDTHELVGLDKLRKCSICGRMFQASINDIKLCTICNMSENHHMLLDDKPYKSLYSMYSNVLPLHVRMFNSTPRYAFEDDEIVVFVVGKKRYILNKVGISSKGYIKSSLLRKYQG